MRSWTGLGLKVAAECRPTFSSLIINSENENDFLNKQIKNGCGISQIILSSKPSRTLNRLRWKNQGVLVYVFPWLRPINYQWRYVAVKVEAGWFFHHTVSFCPFLLVLEWIQNEWAPFFCYLFWMQPWCVCVCGFKCVKAQGNVGWLAARWLSLMQSVFNVIFPLAGRGDSVCHAQCSLWWDQQDPQN